MGGAAAAGRRDHPLLMILDGRAQLPRQHAGGGDPQAWRTIRRLDQGKHAILLREIEIRQMPGNSPRPFRR
jgi:hypothetical protein